MKTQEAILKRISDIGKEDFFGFETKSLICFLDYEHAKPYLDDGVTEEDWEEAQHKDAKVVMVDYMDFAWEKAKDCRGISAYRSMEYYSAWLWLDGNDKLSEEVKHYEYYGKDNLVKICEYLGLDSKKYDDGIRINSEEEK